MKITVYTDTADGWPVVKFDGGDMDGACLPYGGGRGDEGIVACMERLNPGYTVAIDHVAPAPPIAWPE